LEGEPGTLVPMMALHRVPRGRGGLCCWEEQREGFEGCRGRRPGRLLGEEAMAEWYGASTGQLYTIFWQRIELTCMESRLKMNIRQRSSDVANHWPSGLTAIFMIVTESILPTDCSASSVVSLFPRTTLPLDIDPVLQC
jgi:hypothetical protein